MKRKYQCLETTMLAPEKYGISIMISRTPQSHAGFIMKIRLMNKCDFTVFYECLKNLID